MCGDCIHRGAPALFPRLSLSVPPCPSISDSEVVCRACCNSPGSEEFFAERPSTPSSSCLGSWHSSAGASWQLPRSLTVDDLGVDGSVENYCVSIENIKTNKKYFHCDGESLFDSECLGSVDQFNQYVAFHYDCDSPSFVHSFANFQHVNNVIGVINNCCAAAIADAQPLPHASLMPANYIDRAIHSAAVHTINTIQHIPRVCVRQFPFYMQSEGALGDHVEFQMLCDREQDSRNHLPHNLPIADAVSAILAVIAASCHAGPVHSLFCVCESCIAAVQCHRALSAAACDVHRQCLSCHFDRLSCRCVCQ